jgi:hypothetical protein
MSIANGIGEQMANAAIALFVAGLVIGAVIGGALAWWLL